MADKKHIDEFSGIETTGHVWDGLRELNNPLPKWWINTFYVTCIWAIGYWIVMPSWPLITDYTRGFLGYSQRAVVTEQVEEMRALRAKSGSALETASVDEIAADQAMLQFAMANGKAAFGDNCAPCHGTGAEGSKGYPNLNDDAWLWGGTREDIHVTLQYGIRSDHDESRIGDMSAFGRDEILSRKEIRTVANFTRTLSGLEAEEGTDMEAGATLFEENCAACHGEDGTGMREVGAPNLTDSIWLFGSDLDTVIETIHNGRASVMPAWVDRLDPVTVKSLAVYVHSLGGGE